MELKLTRTEVESLKDLIECNLFNVIRNDTNINSLRWLYNIMNIYEKCGGLPQPAECFDGEFDGDEDNRGR